MSDVRFELSPPGVEREYLAGLNECFPGWGGHDRFRALYRTSLGAGEADLLVLRRGERIVAGVALLRRVVAGPDGATARLGILSGGWTLPGERGRGCYSQLMERSRAVGRERALAVVCGFIAAERENVRVFARIADRVIPSWYLVATAAAAPVAAEVELDAAHRGLSRSRRGVGVRYPEAEHLRRRLDVEGGHALHAVAPGWVAAVAGPPERRRLAFVAPVDGAEAGERECFRGLTARSGQEPSGTRQALLGFTTRADRRDAALAAGFEARDGHLMLLASDGDESSPWLSREWDLQEVDRA